MSEMPCSWYNCRKRATVEVGPFEMYCRSDAEREAWRRARSFVMERDRRTCQRCGNGASVVHHLLGRSRRYLRYEAENLVALCQEPCHAELHSHPVKALAWVDEKFGPARIHLLYDIERRGEMMRGSVDLAAVIRGYRERELTPEEMRRYTSGAWLGVDSTP